MMRYLGGVLLLLDDLVDAPLRPFLADPRLLALLLSFQARAEEKEPIF